MFSRGDARVRPSLALRFASIGTAVLAASSFGFGIAGPVAANGIGDLYAASSAGILELHVETARVVNTVRLAPAPTELAFSPDGRTLYAGSGGRHIVTVDIETISESGTIDLPDAAASLAHPKGDELVLAFPSSKTLGVLDTVSRDVIQSRELPGAVDLLASDRRDDRVLASQSGAGWIALFDPGSGSIRTATVAGHVRALALDRTNGVALVATATPDKLVAVTLATMKPAWSATLAGAPDAVASLGKQALVSIGSSIWAVSQSSSKTWATAGGEIATLAPSDEGSVVYAQEPGQVEAFAKDGNTVRTIKLTGTHATVAIAPVPHASSIANGAGGTGTSTASRTGTGGGTAGTGSKVPPTDTVVDDAARWIGGRQILPGALAVGIAILVLGQLAIYLFERRTSP